MAHGDPGPVNPVLDETGANCNVGQTGRVWFSASTIDLTTTRSCTISEKQAVLVFAVGNECSDIEPPPFFGDNEAELANARPRDSTSSGRAPPSVTVDGVAVSNITGYRKQTPVFGYTLPDDNLSERPPERQRQGGLRRDRGHPEAAVAGQHRIVISYESPFLPGQGTTTYDLTVVRRTR